MEKIAKELVEIDRRIEKAVDRMDQYWVNEFMPHRCPYCKGAFSSKYVFKRHINTNKKCKQIKEESGINE